MPHSIGPYELVESRVVYNRTVMQLAAGGAVCKNGDIVAYYNRYTDAIPGNEAHFLRSSDGGVTWQETALPITSRHKEGATHVATGMCVLDDGTVLLPFGDYQSGRVSPDEHPRDLKNKLRPGTLHVAVSKDHAHHWDHIVDVDLPYNFVYPYGRIFRALDGALCLPLYVSEKTTGKKWIGDESASGFVVSRDEGKNWGNFREIVAYPNAQACVETTIARCADNSLLALHRNSSPTLLASRSTDDGETWSDPEPTNLHGECGCVVQDKAGRLIAAYRNHRNAPESVPVGMIVVVSEDNGRTWTPEIILPDPKGRVHEESHETGMPDILLLPDGRLGILYYSFDPRLPHRHPVNDTAWDSVWFFWKRYLALVILRES